MQRIVVAGAARSRRLVWPVLMLLAVGCAGPSGGVSGAASAFTPGVATEVVSVGAAVVPAGQCRTVQQTAWVTAVASVPLQARQTVGADGDRLACDIARQRVQSLGEERCRTNYAGNALYRNGLLLPLTLGTGDCRCVETTDRTTCEVSVTGQCGYEELQTRAEQVCN